jgi:hypothetical protein
MAQPRAADPGGSQAVNPIRLGTARVARYPVPLRPRRALEVPLLGAPERSPGTSVATVGRKLRSTAIELRSANDPSAEQHTRTAPTAEPTGRRVTRRSHAAVASRGSRITGDLRSSPRLVWSCLPMTPPSRKGNRSPQRPPLARSDLAGLATKG